MKTALSIAGSDSSGGAGIQADLKTFAAHNVYGMTVITAITAQNTLGVQACSATAPALVTQQLQSVFNDITPNATKIGMLKNRQIVTAVATQLMNYNAHNVVLDPVMMATSGGVLTDPSATHCLIKDLIPQANLITPNVHELISLCQTHKMSVPNQKLNRNDLKQLTDQLFQVLPPHTSGQRVAILSKGGHLAGPDSTDYLKHEGDHHWIEGDKINSSNTHGTGCTLSSAIAAQLALNNPLLESCVLAKRYLTEAIQQNLNLGHGNGPLKHNL